MSHTDQPICIDVHTLPWSVPGALSRTKEKKTKVPCDGSKKESTERMQLLAFRGSSAPSIGTLSLVTGIGFLDSLDLSFGGPRSTGTTCSVVG